MIYWSTIHAPGGEQRIGPTAAYLLSKRPCRIIIETENRPARSSSAAARAARPRRVSAPEGVDSRSDVHYADPIVTGVCQGMRQEDKEAGMQALYYRECVYTMVHALSKVQHSQRLLYVRSVTADRSASSSSDGGSHSRARAPWPASRARPS